MHGENLKFLTLLCRKILPELHSEMAQELLTYKGGIQRVREWGSSLWVG